MIIAGLSRYDDWRHVATGCNALVYVNRAPLEWIYPLHFRYRAYIWFIQIRWVYRGKESPSRMKLAAAPRWFHSRIFHPCILDAPHFPLPHFQSSAKKLHKWSVRPHANVFWCLLYFRCQYRMNVWDICAISLIRKKNTTCWNCL